MKFLVLGIKILHNFQEETPLRRAHAEALRHDVVTVQETIRIAGGGVMLAVGFCIGGDEQSVRGVGQYSNECVI